MGDHPLVPSTPKGNHLPLHTPKPHSHPRPVKVAGYTLAIPLHLWYNGQLHAIPLRPSLTCSVFLHRFSSLALHLPASHLSLGRHLVTAPALPLRTVEGVTGHPAVYSQGLCAWSAYVPPVLSKLQPPASTC